MKLINGLMIMVQLCIIGHVQAQPVIDSHDNEIMWITSHSWAQVKQKAILENKYIFLDCYTTWCKPCKMMDRDVYSNDTVGRLLNKKFISVRVQMDSTSADKGDVKNWYKDAHDIKMNYGVYSYPAYLIFTPDGKIVYHGVGLKSVDEFVALIDNACDRDKQVYRLLEQYRSKKLHYSKMPDLIYAVNTVLKDKELVFTIARDYLINYLYKFKVESLLTKDNISFINAYIQSSRERGFALFYKYGNQIDRIMRKPGYSQGVVDYIITKEEIEPILSRNDKTKIDKPNWNKISSMICKKYNKSYAERTVINAQISWYQEKKDWETVAKLYVKKIDKYGIDTTGMGKFSLNNMIWDVIFLHSSDKVVITKGIEWMEELLKLDSSAQSIDTYANLLYKIGRTQEAIAWEEKALNIDRELTQKFKMAPNMVYHQTLEKMKKNIPTWGISD